MAINLTTYVYFVIIIYQIVCQVEVIIAVRLPALDFPHRSLVKPKIYDVRGKRSIEHTRQENGEHIDQLQISLDVDGKLLLLDLGLNKHLMPKGFFYKHQDKGKYVTHILTKKEIDHCRYNGNIRGRPNSWVAISTCYGLSGVIHDGIETYYIEKDDNESESLLDTRHLVYKYSIFSSHLRNKRSTDDIQLIRGPYIANKDSKYIELILVVDNQLFKELGENKEKTILWCKNIAHFVNALYAPLNIFIALVGVEIWSEKDEIEFSKNGDVTLKNFLHYRKTKLNPEHPNDNAQLLTKFAFDYGVFAKALKGPICTHEYSGGVNVVDSSVTNWTATLIAHSLGHNFGMEHDTENCTCPDDRCIMSPGINTTGRLPTHWSSCSFEWLLSALAGGMDYCLRNKPESLFDGPVCGNGYVEPGEECDCGLPDHCNNTCCDTSTCKLVSNATCGTGECCDLETCTLKRAGIQCRSADFECDLSEYCTGQSEYCPADVYKMDSDPCGNGEAFCYKGSCRTKTDQCKLLWGETGKSSHDQCYNLNAKGSRHGNCGYNKFNQTYLKCELEDIQCGMLHCNHISERLEFGMESVSILSHSFLSIKGSIVPCRTVMVDLGTQRVDPGLTPDGAKCGEGKMCVDQKCKNIADLRKKIPLCPKNCHGNGWCNNRGHCHCKNGFAPPLCEYPGPGGSEDSGPPTDPNARSQRVIDAILLALNNENYIHNSTPKYVLKST